MVDASPSLFRRSLLLIALCATLAQARQIQHTDLASLAYEAKHIVVCKRGEKRDLGRYRYAQSYEIKESLQGCLVVGKTITPKGGRPRKLTSKTLRFGSSQTRTAFFVCGDPQYLAEKAASPTRLDPNSEEAAIGFIKTISNLAESKLPKAMGGGAVSPKIEGIIVTGDLIDSLDKRGGHYPAMQRFEWQRFLDDFGLNGNDGKIPFPVHELHGNHDGPQGDTFVVEEIIARNRTRRNIHRVSKNGLHYSWRWGPIHFVNLGMFVGEGEKRREGHHYAARSSLEFLRRELATSVNDSGRPVVLSHHLHLDAPEYDWPKEDLEAYWKIVEKYNVVAIFNGHTHGSPPRKRVWNGTKVGRDLVGVDNYDPDDAAASKIHKEKPVGVAHGFLYVELLVTDGEDEADFVVRSARTRDNWKTWEWHQVWKKKVSLGAMSTSDITPTSK